MNKMLKIALSCWAIPLLLGIIIFGTWMLTHWEALVMPGLYLWGGYPFVFLVGLVCTLIYLWKERQTRSVSARIVWRNAGITTLLLLCNFAVGAGMIVRGIDLETRYYVVVHNNTSQAIESLRLEAPGTNTDLGPIMPGEKFSHWFHVQGEGALTYRARQGSKSFAGTVDGYVTSNLGGRKLLVVNPAANVAIQGEL